MKKFRMPALISEVSLGKIPNSKLFSRLLDGQKLRDVAVG